MIVCQCGELPPGSIRQGISAKFPIPCMVIKVMPIRNVDIQINQEMYETATKTT
jgi:hypothetical protein